MKKRYFIRGLGVGILLTALVLCIGYRQHNSEETVVQRARELGMIFPQKTPDTLLTASGSATVVSPSPEPTKEITIFETVSPSAVNATATATATATTLPTATVTATAKTTAKTNTKKEMHIFTVRSGLLSSSVARELKEAGIIKDADAFDEYLEKSGMGRKLRAGKYRIPIGADYSEIAKIITRSDG